ncbi:MAG: hypothetical protein ACYS19_12945, partial [Planctomycetota bacterium]
MKHNQYQLFVASVRVVAVLSVSLVFMISCTSPGPALKEGRKPGGGHTLTVSLVTDSTVGPAARHGIEKVHAALLEKGVSVEEVVSVKAAQGNLLVVLGIFGGGSGKSGTATKLHEGLDIPGPVEAESLLVRHTNWAGKKTLLVSGADDRGLMYALLDVAERIRWSNDPSNPLSEVRDVQEKPAVVERA